MLRPMPDTKRRSCMFLKNVHLPCPRKQNKRMDVATMIIFKCSAVYKLTRTSPSFLFIPRNLTARERGPAVDSEIPGS